MFNSGANNNSAVGSTNVYGLSLKSRAISHVSAETELNRFLVGTCTLKEDNEICLLEEKENEGFKSIGIYSHPKEIWSITSCTFNPNQFFTVYNNNGSEYKTSLWSINQDTNQLDELFQLGAHKGYIKPILCDPLNTDEYVISLDDTNIRLWSGINNNNPTETKSFGNLNKLTAGCINPNVKNQLATANDINIKGWDFRTNKETFTIDKAHSELIRDIDFNPNRAYYLLSAGEDGKLKFWDTRQTAEPVKMFTGHSHWIWNAKFNKFYDQLVITSSSDNTVKLWNVYSISSNNTDDKQATTDEKSPPNTATVKKNKKKEKEDHLIKTFEEHEDSIYNVCWSSSNFLFASISYDGRVVLNNVPKEYSDILSY